MAMAIIALTDTAIIIDRIVIAILAITIGRTPTSGTRIDRVRLRLAKALAGIFGAMPGNGCDCHAQALRLRIFVAVRGLCCQGYE
jgi:hypothetical protein